MSKAGYLLVFPYLFLGVNCLYVSQRKLNLCKNLITNLCTLTLRKIKFVSQSIFLSSIIWAEIIKYYFYELYLNTSLKLKILKKHFHLEIEIKWNDKQIFFFFRFKTLLNYSFYNCSWISCKNNPTCKQTFDVDLFEISSHPYPSLFFIRTNILPFRHLFVFKILRIKEEVEIISYQMT